jgi:hypothetical protein
VNSFSLNEYLIDNLAIQNGVDEVLKGVDAEGRNREQKYSGGSVTAVFRKTALANGMITF